MDFLAPNGYYLNTTTKFGFDGWINEVISGELTLYLLSKVELLGISNSD